MLDGSFEGNILACRSGSRHHASGFLIAQSLMDYKAFHHIFIISIVVLDAHSSSVNSVFAQSNHETREIFFKVCPMLASYVFVELLPVYKMENRNVREKSNNLNESYPTPNVTNNLI